MSSPRVPANPPTPATFFSSDAPHEAPSQASKQQQIDQAAAGFFFWHQRPATVSPSPFRRQLLIILRRVPQGFLPPQRHTRCYCFASETERPGRWSLVPANSPSFSGAGTPEDHRESVLGEFPVPFFFSLGCWSMRCKFRLLLLFRRTGSVTGVLQPLFLPLVQLWDQEQPGKSLLKAATTW